MSKVMISRLQLLDCSLTIRCILAIRLPIGMVGGPAFG